MRRRGARSLKTAPSDTSPSTPKNLSKTGTAGIACTRGNRNPPSPQAAAKIFRTMQELYKEILLDHSQHPRNQGELENADIEGHLLNPLCGDEVTVYAVFDGGDVADVKFVGRGCSISQASASMMTERLLGKSRKEVEVEIKAFKDMMTGDREFPNEDELSALKGVIQYPSRIRCATLAWNALQQGLKSRD